jgi:SAM-dependent methyltransferase
MNRKISTFLQENLRESFKLSRWDSVREKINDDTVIVDLPWTPARLQKFKDKLLSTFQLDDVDLHASVSELTDEIDVKYSARFWGQGVWQPRTDVYQYTGWNIVDDINKREPRKVLDVGCGYNQFKPRIDNLIGIDKFNNSADYMVDILDFNVEPESFDAVIVFGSINFGDWDDMSIRYKKVFELLAPGGRVYVRANPGHTHKNGPWIDIFPWSFEYAHKIAKENDVELVTFKQDNGDRLFFLFEKK